MSYMYPPFSSKDITSLPEFAQGLVLELALPVLAQGYSGLVRKWRNNPELEVLAKEKGPDAVLSADNAEMAALRKHNKELVTAAEKEAERRMTEAVRQRFPHDAVIGEELGFSPGGGRRWVFDPVDGTSAMLRTALAEAFGLPLPEPVPAFGITAGLVDGDEAILGIVVELLAKHDSLKAGDVWMGEKGQPTLCNGIPVTLPEPPGGLSACGLACTVPRVMFNTPEKWSGFQALMEATHHSVPDQNCIGFMRLLQKGSLIDIAYEADLAYHDVAALVPILQGAGIGVSNGEGQKLKFPENAISKEFSVLAAQASVHAQALSCIRKGVNPKKNNFASADASSHGYISKFSG